MTNSILGILFILYYHYLLSISYIHNNLVKHYYAHFAHKQTKRILLI